MNEFYKKTISIKSDEIHSSKVETWFLKNVTHPKATASGFCSITKENHFEYYSQTFEMILAAIFEPTFAYLEKEMHIYLFEKIQIDKYLESFQSICFFQSIPDSCCTFCDKVSHLPRLEEWRVDQCFLESITCHDNIPDKELFKIKFKNRENGLLIKNSVELNPFTLFEIQYHVPWPISQILTDKNQSRYSQIFSFLANLYLSKKRLNESRLDVGVCQTRLYALSFVNSLSSYSIHNVIIPIISNIKWRECRTMDAIIEAHETMLTAIESKLFFKVRSSHFGISKIIRCLLLKKQLKRCF